MGIKRQTFLEYGSGDIEVVTCRIGVDSEERIGILLKATKPQTPGLRRDPIEWGPQDADVVISFPNIEYAKLVLSRWNLLLEDLEAYIEEEKEKENGT